MLITRKFEFDAAHTLQGLDEKEKNIHGHRYVLEVTLKGMPKNGIIMDLNKVKKNYKSYCLRKIRSHFS